MTNSFYNANGTPGTGAKGASAPMRAELLAVQAGFDKFPAFSGNALKLLRINAGATALEAYTLPAYAPLNGAGTSGTWPIGVTGNAATATKLATARTINGGSFDGSANVTIPAFAIDNSSNANFRVPFMSSGIGNANNFTNASFLYNPSTGVLSVGSITGNAETATSVAWSGVTGKPAAVTSLSGTNTGDQTSVTGNAGTATKLATARTINGVSFDGSANITISATDASKLPLAGGTLTGPLSGTTAVFSGALSSGAITQQSGYFNIYPHSGTYDDGGYARAFWDGNNGKLIFRRNGGSGAAGAAIDATSFIGALVGNASTATALQTARTINGVLFDGTANITVADATKMPLTGGTMTGVIGAGTYSIAHNNGNAFRIIHDSGFLSGYDAANSVRTGYLQFNAHSNVTLFAESGNLLRLYADAALKLQLSGTLADFKCAAQTTPATVAYAASLTIDTSTSNLVKVGTLTGNVTSMSLTNATEGQFLSIRFKQDGPGGRTVAAPAGAKIDGSIQTGANRTSYLNLTYNATDTRWEGNWFQVPA